jgi:hypothetical protein
MHRILMAFLWLGKASNSAAVISSYSWLPGFWRTTIDGYHAKRELSARKECGKWQAANVRKKCVR